VAAFIYFKRQQKQEAAGKGAPPAAPGAPRKAAPKVPETPEAAYMNLRQKAIGTDPQRLGLPGVLKEDELYGALMEMGIPNSVVTLACFADGDARLYYKTGGGMIGGVDHETVRAASREFIALAQKALPRMIKTTNHPLPDPDRVRFYVLTPRGVFTTETNRQSLSETKSDLSALFYSGQEVVAQMRQVQEEKSQAAGAANRPAPVG
jgi:hypothetical protein